MSNKSNAIFNENRWIAETCHLEFNTMSIKTEKKHEDNEVALI